MATTYARCALNEVPTAETGLENLMDQQQSIWILTDWKLLSMPLFCDDISQAQQWICATL